MENGYLPKMEDHFELHEWFYLEDHFHLPSNTLLDDAPIMPTITYSDLKPNFSTNYFLEHPKTTTCTQNLDTFGEDFHLWSETPSLIEHEWESLSLFPPPLDQFELNSFDNLDQFLLNDFSFDDETLEMIVAEGVAMAENSHENFMEAKFVNGSDDHIMKKEKFKRIKGENLKTSNKKIESISYEELRKYFNVPISKAAKELNVGLTILKKRCRELNIKRWPHRKIKSLEALISNVKEEQGMMEMVKFLEDYKRKLHFVPGLELDAETKRLRQQFFKANYKKRRALALARGHHI